MTFWLICCGSRDWDDQAGLVEALGLIFNHARAVTKRGPAPWVVHGGQTSRRSESGLEQVWGADHQWGVAASHWMAAIRVYPVDWVQARRELGSHWRLAGMDRNERMLTRTLAEMEPEDRIQLAAAHDDPSLGAGTHHMVRIALSSGIHCWRVKHKTADVRDGVDVKLIDRARFERGIA